MKIRVLEKTPGCLPEILKVGDWIDLKLAEEVKLEAPYVKEMKRKGRKNAEESSVAGVVFPSATASLGIAVKLPKGMEAVIVPRSSLFKKYGVIQNNMVGVIDNLYCGMDDEWKIPLTALRKTTIPKGVRVAQFRIQPSQKATCWQKLRWLLASTIKVVRAKGLGNINRGGFGSTGEK